MTIKVDSPYFLLLFLFLSNGPSPYVGSLLIYFFSFIYLLNKNFRVSLNSFEMDLLKYWFLLWLVMFISFIMHFSHVNNLFWGIFTFSAILVVPLIFQSLSLQTIIKSLKMFIAVQALLMSIQYICLVKRFGTLDVYAVTGVAAGDSMAGTAIGFSSIISVTLFFCAFILFHNSKTDKKLFKWGVVSFLLAFLPSYNAAILIAVFSIIFYFMINGFAGLILRFKVTKSISIVIIILLSTISFVYYQWANVVYSFNIIRGFLSAHPPNKIVAFYDVLLTFPTKYPLDSFMGVGFGNYSSRAAFIVSGDYLSPQPSFIPITPSKFFDEFMHPLFNSTSLTQVIGGVIGTSMINAPFAQIISIIGEGGLVGILLFVMIAFKCYQKFRYQPFLLISLMFFIGIMFLDNWLEYPSVAIMFWFMVKNSSHNGIKL